MLRLGRPVAANGQGLRRKMRLQQRLGIGAAHARAALHNFRVARQLLVNPHRLGADMDQRIEPEHTAHHGHNGVDPCVVAVEMNLLMRQDQLALVIAEAALEIVRRHDARMAEADNCRASEPDVCFPHEGPLPPHQQRRKRRHSCNPQRTERDRQPCVRRGALDGCKARG